MGALTVHYVDDGALVATERDLFVGAWWHTATAKHVEAVREATVRMLADHSHYATALLVMDGEGVFSFSEDVRRGVVDLVRATEDSGIGTALVIFRRGFVGSAVRAFVTGAFLVARSKEPQKAFADIQPAAAWLADCFRARDPATAWTTPTVEHTLAQVLAHAEAARSG